MLNIAKNLYRRRKVTLLTLSAALMLAATARADEPQTFVTTKGERFEKGRVTEVTPATITIVHAAGIARVPLSELPVEVQKRFNYDPDKAKAWLDQIVEQERQRAITAENQRKAAAAERRAKQIEIEAELARMRAAMRAVYDSATRRWYSSQEEAAAAREQALKDALAAKAAARDH